MFVKEGCSWSSFDRGGLRQRGGRDEGRYLTFVTLLFFFKKMANKKTQRKMCFFFTS